MIPNHIIERVIETANIQEVIGDYVSLKKKGVNYLGNCPFHNEKTASFVVSPSKGIYKCFGCGAGGNVIRFIQEHESLNYPQAIEHVAKRYNIEIPKRELTSEEKASADKRSSYFGMNTYANDFYEHNLNRSQAAKYMKERGFKTADLKAFSIGCATDARAAFLNASAAKGYTQDSLVWAGLIGKNENGYYDKFRSRVMFPIHNLTGQVIGFTGRVLEKNSKYAKYLNTPETDYFKKGQLLYGLFQAKRHITKEGCAYLVEGNTDVIRWHQKGLQNTVATCGTALTEHHARLIRRFTNNLTIVFDGDPAGLKAAIRGVEICLAEGLNVYVAVLPEGEDPDSFGQTHTPKELQKWLEDNSKDFVTFRASQAKEEIEKKPAEKAALIKELLDIVKTIPDLATREIYFGQVAEQLSIDRQKFEAGIFEVPEEDLFGIETNRAAITKEDEIMLFDSREEAMKWIARDHENVVAFTGKLTPEQIGKLNELSRNIAFMGDIEADWSDGEPEIVKQLKFLVERGFKVSYSWGDSDGSFIEYYFASLSTFNFLDTDEKKRNIEAAAEFLAKLDNTTINMKMTSVAKQFGIAKGDFNKILSPYVNKKKGVIAQKNADITVDGITHHFDADNLPDYVDQKFLRKYKHFAFENASGKKLFYVFQNENGNLAKVGNFFMEPLFQVFHDDPNKNKRIVRLNHSEDHSSDYVEIPSNELIEFGAFKKFLWRQGPYTLSGAKSWHLDYIIDSIAMQFPKTYELEIFGQQHEGFFAFSNAIVVDGEIRYMNELGLIDHDGKTFYSPSVSMIYKNLRQDNDKFSQQRNFIYKKGSNVTFEQWGALLTEVYKYNHNGHWALLMAILSAFRSEIFPIDRLFTTLFLTGPTECGKTQIAVSIRSLFVDSDAPMFNLNSGTDASLFTLLEMYRDVPVVLEEYNDMQITDIKFQGLKAAVYDGEGKTKRKDATSRDLDQSEVNAVPILLGQEAPERDDNSLANRTVLCPVKKKDDWTEEEINNFKTLKEWEKEGLTHVLVKILGQRSTIRKHFQKKLRIVQKEMRKELQAAGIPFQTRILNTISLFLALVKLFEEHVDDLKLPFTYEEFYPIARKKLIDQSESITSSNRLSVFFETFVSLAEDQRNGMKFGREYKIELLDSIQLRFGRDKVQDIHYEEPKRILFMRLDQIHAKYKKIVGADEHLKMNNLKNYLMDHPAHLGPVKQTLFSWEDEVRTNDAQGTVISKMQPVKKRTSAIAFDYDLLGIDLGEQHFSNEVWGEQQDEISIQKPQWPQKQLDFESVDTQGSDKQF